MQDTAETISSTKYQSNWFWSRFSAFLRSVDWYKPITIIKRRFACIKSPFVWTLLKKWVLNWTWAKCVSASRTNYHQGKSVWEFFSDETCSRRDRKREKKCHIFWDPFWSFLPDPFQRTRVLLAFPSTISPTCSILRQKYQLRRSPIVFFPASGS